MRAAQYCEAVTLASGFGWSLFVPVEILLLWDGRSILWSRNGEEWQVVDDYAHFPDFPQAFDMRVPQDLRGLAPAFLTALPEPGLIQVSLGLFARTAPGWSMLIRGPPNVPLTSPIEHFEGLVDTSQWFGPLFVNLRLTKTDVPIRLYENRPFAHAQPIPHSALTREALAFETVDQIGVDEWKAYGVSAAEPSTRPDRLPGAYAIKQRRNRKEPFASACSA